jgi:hypothetical protein
VRLAAPVPVGVEPSPPAPVLLQSQEGKAKLPGYLPPAEKAFLSGQPQRGRVRVAAVGRVAVGRQRQGLGTDRLELAQIVAGAAAGEAGRLGGQAGRAVGDEVRGQLLVLLEPAEDRVQL